MRGLGTDVKHVNVDPGIASSTPRTPTKITKRRYALVQGRIWAQIEFTHKKGSTGRMSLSIGLERKAYIQLIKKNKLTLLK